MFRTQRSIDGYSTEQINTVPAFVLSKAVTQTIVQNTETPITWPDIIKIQKCTFDGTELTILETGVYTMSFGISFVSGNFGFRWFYVTDGVNRYGTIRNRFAPSGTYAETSSFTHEFAKGTVLWVEVYHNRGSDLALSGANSTLRCQWGGMQIY